MGRWRSSTHEPVRGRATGHSRIRSVRSLLDPPPPQAAPRHPERQARGGRMRTALSRHIAALRRHIGMALFGAALLLGLGSIATAPAATTAAAGCEEDPYCHNMP